MSDYVYGIDFGTSNSVIEVYDLEQDAVVSTNGSTTKSIESAIYFPAGENRSYFIGADAVQEYVKSEMKGRFIKSIKSALPIPFLSQISVHGRGIKIEEIISYFLKTLKAEHDALLGKDVKKVVLGRPVTFSEKKSEEQLAEKRLFQAAKMAGFKEIKFLAEPLAAAVDYTRTIDTPRKVFVGDIGAGTSDLCILNVIPDSSKAVATLENDSIFTSGFKIGGDDFDAEIMWKRLVDYFGYGAEYESYGKWLPVPAHIFRTICSWEKLSTLKRVDMQTSLKKFQHFSNEREKISRLITLVNNNLGFALIKNIERAKIDLSNVSISEINFDRDDILIKEQIDVANLEDIVAPFVKVIQDKTLQLLDKSKTDVSDIDVVVLTGGSTLVSSVKAMFADVFGYEKIKEADAFKSVAAGLASASPHLFN